MPTIFAPLLPEYTINIPVDFIFWTVWLLICGMLLLFIFRYRDKHFKLERRSLFWLALLSVLVLIFTPFFGTRLAEIDPTDRVESPVQHIMFLAAVPWLVAGGVGGMIPAALLAGLSGVFLAYLDTHNLFTPLTFIAAAIIFTWCVRQQYRTAAFRILRFPLGAALFSSILVIPLIFLAVLLSSPGLWALRFAAAMSTLPVLVVSFGIMLLIGGTVCTLVRFFAAKSWVSIGPLVPSPFETSLKFRYFAVIIPLMMVLFGILLTFQWQVARASTRRLLLGRLTSMTDAVANSLALYKETGEEFILELVADEAFPSVSTENFANFLLDKPEIITFFDDLIIFNAIGEIVASYPPSFTLDHDLNSHEVSAIDLALAGEMLQVISIHAGEELTDSRFGFIARNQRSSNTQAQVVLGRSDFSSSATIKPIMFVLNEFAQNGGLVQIITGEGDVLFHTDPQQVGAGYSGIMYSTPTYFEQVSPAGDHEFLFYQPVSNTGLAILAAIPEERIQVLAWDLIYPVMLTVAGGMFIVVLVGLVGLSPLVKGIKQLKVGLDGVAKGNFILDLPHQTFQGELGQLHDVVRTLVFSLRNRYEKQTDLMSLNQRLSEGVGLQEGLALVMKAALADGVSTVRIILFSQGNPGLSRPKIDQCMGLGKHNHLLAVLDEAIAIRTHSQGVMVVRESQIAKLFPLDKNLPYPASLISIPLRWEKAPIGVLWVTYTDRRILGDSEVQFLEELSKRASATIASSRAHEALTMIKLQFESVMDKLEDAVLIMDKSGWISYSNQTAQSWFARGNLLTPHKNISDIFPGYDWFMVDKDKTHPRENLEELVYQGREYQVQTCPMVVNQQIIGLAMIFKDKTESNLKDALRTEFVTTVSHELRSPLTLMHGYAKIMKLTGNLNEQQDSYISNIIDGLEEMKNLVQNLLDIGRLETSDAMDITRFSIGDFAKKVIKSMGAQAKQKNIELILSLPDAPGRLEADETFLMQALKNLLENAIKFSKIGGEVILTVREKEGKVTFAVRDYGIGIAPLDQQRLFVKFRQIHTPTEQDQKGSGLGLAIVKTIAERHHGKVWLESQLGKGSIFYLQIPAKSPI